MLELKDGAARAPVSNCPRAATKSTLWRSPAPAWIGEGCRLATRVKLLRETDELLKDDTAGHDVRDLGKETGLEDVTMNVPHRRSQRAKKKIKAHKGDHRATKFNLWRSRAQGWIVESRRLATTV